MKVWRFDIAAALLTLRTFHAAAVEVPMTRPLATSAQTMRTAPILLIDLETEEGVTGHAYPFCYARIAPGLTTRCVIRNALGSLWELVAASCTRTLYLSACIIF
jgi:hypothetical protein